MLFLKKTYAFSHLRQLYTVIINAIFQETITKKNMSHDFKQVEVVSISFYSDLKSTKTQR